MPRTRLIVGAVALALAASSAHAQRFSGVISFGDSLSDAGNVGLVTNPAGGPSQSFTTNPDPVMVELLARYFGFTQAPSLAGGSNFAFGGACARTATGPTSPPCSSYSVPRLNQQIDLALAGGSANPNALYTVWMGANDLFGDIPVWAANPATASANAQVGGIPVATAVVQQVARLQAAGARNIVVLNLPDLGVTPQFSSGPLAAAGPLATLATVSFNGALSQGLAQLGTGIIPINVFGLVNEVRANPAAFGFTNVTGVACTVPSSLLCTQNTLVAPGANNTYLFADGVHPTGAAHRLLTNVTIATINAPTIVALAPEASIAAYEEHGGAIRNALFDEHSGDREDGSVRTWAVLGGGSGNLAGSAFSPEADTSAFNASFGANYRMSEAFTFGLAASFGNQNLKPVGGDIKSNTVLLSGYGVLNFGGFSATAILSGGSTNLDIRRDIALGPSVRSDKGETDGDHVGAELMLAYTFKGDGYAHGPFAGVAWQEVEVAAYAEDGANSTSMNFGDFTRESMVSFAGYQLKADFDTLQPFVRAAWNREDKTDRTVVNAGSNSMGGRFALEGFAPAKDWTSVELGLGFTFSENLGGHVVYSGRFGDDVVDRDRLGVGLTYRF
ncbi:MAG: lipase/esterase [Silanimonas sp.]|nr:MAG: lipase/esterase [Silanimonas sp.]